MNIPHPIFQSHMTMPDGRRFHSCGCIDVAKGWYFQPFLLCARHHDGRFDLNPTNRERQQTYV